MYIFHHINDLAIFIEKAKSEGKTIGFAPTMGALHQGHISLIEAARQKNNIVVASIFVNPTQFNNPEDLIKYPKTLDQDVYLLEQASCNVLFLPTVEEMYPNGLSERSNKSVGAISEKLEGAFRPGHFEGVITIVEKLLNMVQPHDLYMGQKDYQQCLVIQALLPQLSYAVNFHMVPTKREADGLAKSSRNTRLTEGQRQQANLIYQCLISIQAQKETKSFAIVKKECEDLLVNKGITPEYILLCDAHTLDTLEEYDLSKSMIVLIAAYLGDIRLIDNLVL